MLRVGTWNMSHWTEQKALLVAGAIDVDILAIQETQLAVVPLERAHTTVRRARLHLHHGRPAVAQQHSEHGKSCGVGFLCREGVAVAPAVPSCTAWRMLHALRRTYGVLLPPRAGLPRGLLLLSIYAPLREHGQATLRARFDLALLELLHCLDMQVPTLLLGDFNGSACPSRDFHSISGARRPACPLLGQLLGPGGPLVDVHAALHQPPLSWTFQAVDSRGQLSASRIDLALANHAAMQFVRAITVVDDIRDGGHSPVVVELRLSSGVINWRPPPRPQLPPLLRQSSAELRASAQWTSLVDEWQRSPPARAALAPQRPPTLESLSRALLRALQHLVALAGGWVTRSTHRRPAYASDDLRQARRRLSLLHRLDTLLERDLRSPAAHPSPGCWPRPWVVLLDALQREMVSLPRTNSAALQRAVTTEALQTSEAIARLERMMRQERRVRWKAGLATMWRERPGAIQHWLRATDAPWGSRPVLDSAGLQCLTVETVDAAVRGYWVDVVLRQHADVDEAARWAAFEASEFGAHVPTTVWPSTPWTGDRVRSVLSSMREAAAPGLTGIPIAVWRSLPSPWHDAVARLLALVEAAGRWPAEWLQAYVAMIPKASGGSRPRDQRPITVLEVMYRIWSKGTV